MSKSPKNGQKQAISTPNSFLGTGVFRWLSHASLIPSIRDNRLLRPRAKGNVFALLFGAVALTGVLAAVGMQTLTGPVTTITRVTQKNIADTQLLMNAKIIVNAAVGGADDGDPDDDGLIELAPWPVVGGGETPPTGGGFLPTDLGLSLTDPWGTKYGYCSWDHGSPTNSSARRLTGDNTLDAHKQPVIAIIAAGPDKVFQSTCPAFTSGMIAVTKASGSDDLIFTYTYAQASASSNGLWTINTGDKSKAELKGSGGNNAPPTVTIDRDTGVGDFIGLSTSTIAAKGAFVAMDGALKLDNAVPDLDCDISAPGAIRFNAGSTPKKIEYCDGVTWKAVGSDLWVTDETDIWRLTGNVGIGNGAPTEKLDVTGNIKASGNGVFGGTLGVTGNTTLGGTLGVTGASTLASLGVTNNATVGGTLGVTGNTTLTGTLGVTGAATMSNSLDVIGNFAVNTNKFTVAAASGNTVVGGTFGAGASTLASLDVTGNASVGGTLGATGDTTLAGKLFVAGDAAFDTNTLYVKTDTNAVGIGTATPAARLDVDGGIKVGMQGTCDAGGANDGTIRYDSSTLRMEYCVASAWRRVSSVNLLDDVGDVQIGEVGVPADNSLLAWDAGGNRWVAKSVNTVGNATIAVPGDNGSVQFKTGTSLDADEDYFVYDKATHRLAIGGDSPDETLDVTGTAAVSGDMTVGGAFTATGVGAFGNNVGVAGNLVVDTTTFAVNATSNAVGVGTTSPTSMFQVASGGYAQFSKNFAGAPTAGDCDDAAEVGRMTYDVTNNNWYVCTSASGWVYTNMGASGGTANAGGTDKMVQFNDNGPLAGAATMGWDKATGFLGVGTLSPDTLLTLSTASTSGQYVPMIKMVQPHGASTTYAEIALSGNNVRGMKVLYDDGGDKFGFTTQYFAPIKFYSGNPNTPTLQIGYNGASAALSNKVLLNLTGTAGAASGSAVALHIPTTLSANANNDALYGFYINPTYDDNSKTGVTHTDIGFDGTVERSIVVARNSVSDTAGSNLAITAGAATSGATDKGGGSLTLSGGVATGNGMSSIQFKTARPGQGAGTTDRIPAVSMTLSSNALTLPSGPTAQQPGQAGMQASVDGMIRYDTDKGKYQAYQSGAWQDILTSAPGNSISWSSLSDPTDNMALNMGAYTSTFTFDDNTGANNLFNFVDTANNTGTGYMVNIATATGSTLKPFHVSAAGVDAITVLENGYVGIGTTTPTARLTVGRSAGRYVDLAGGGGRSIMVGNDNSDNIVLTLQNSRDGGYGAGLAFNLGYDGSPDNTVVGTALAGVRLLAKPDQTWTSTASTQDAGLLFGTILDGAFTYRMKLSSEGYLGIGTTAPTDLFDVASTGYPRFRKNFAGAPTAGDCDAAGEVGRMTYDTTNNRWYVCTSASGWVYSAMGTSGGTAGADKQVIFNDNGALAGAATLAWDKVTGYLGIGTTTPTGVLDVQGGTAASGNGTNITLAAQNGFGTGNTNGGNILLDAGIPNGTGTKGGLLIGTVNPTAVGVGIASSTVGAPLHVFGDDATTRVVAAFEGTTDKAAVRIGNRQNVGVAGKYLEFMTDYDEPIIRSVGYGQHLSIKSSTGVITTPNTVIFNQGYPALSNSMYTLRVGHGAGNNSNSSPVLQGSGGLGVYALDSGSDLLVVETPNNPHGQALLTVKQATYYRFFIDNAGKIGIGTNSPSNTMSFGGNTNNVIAMERTTSGTDGLDLTLRSGGAKSGETDKNGGSLFLSSGTATGNGMSSVQFSTVKPGQGTGTTDRAPAVSMVLSSNALTLPSGPTSEQPGQSGMQASVAGMIRYDTDEDRFKAYQDGAWQDILTSATGNIVDDSLDFDKFVDAMTLDASTDIAASGTNVLSITNTGTGNSFVVNDEASDASPFVIDAAGRVGIGVATPNNSAILDVAGVIRVPSNGQNLWFSDQGTSIGHDGGGGMRYNGGNGHTFYDNSNNNLFRIDNDGKTFVKNEIIFDPTTTPMEIRRRIDTADAAAAGLFLHAGDQNFTDRAGGDLTLAGGRGAGTGAGGAILLQTAAAGGVSNNTTNALTTRVTITSAGRVGIGTTTPSSILSFSGDALRVIGMERATSGAGSALQVVAGGAESGSTDQNGGPLRLRSGTATGSGSSSIIFETATAGATGTADRAVSIKMVILGNGSVGVGTSTPNASAIMDLTSTTQGFLPPRLTAAQISAISSPANGLMVYDSDLGRYRAYQGGSWNEILTSAPGNGIKWSALSDPNANMALAMGDYTSTFTYGATTGANDLFNLTDTNSNTGTGYLLNLTTGTGSTLKPLHVAAGGVEAIAVNAAGNVGIGTTTPITKLNLAGDKSAAAWTTNGIGLRIDPATYTDTSSSGTINSVVHLIGAPTLAASSAVTTNTAVTLKVLAPVAGTNVTLNGAYAVQGLGNLNISGRTHLGSQAGGIPSAVLSVAGDQSLTASSWAVGEGAMLKVIPATLTATTGSGTVATRVGNSFGIPTFASTNANTLTNAATVYIDGAPTAGTNTTITNAQALHVAAGNSYFGGTVGVGTTTPNASAALDVSSTTQGFLPPRMTTTEVGNIASPANGLFVYDTTVGRYKAYQGGAWSEILTSAPGNGIAWSSLSNPVANLALSMAGYTTNFTYGNATGASTDMFTLADTASNTGTGYLLNVATGTSSAAKPFRVAAAGTEAIMVDASGRIGMGIVAPQYKLQVRGDAPAGDFVGVHVLNHTTSLNSQASIGFSTSTSTSAITGKISALRTSTTEHAMTFSTTSNSVTSERMRIDSLGNVIVGTGEASATVTGNTLRGPDPAGTDKTGANLTIRGGLGTGAGATGDVIFQSAPAGSTGTTAQTAATGLIFKGGSGYVGLGTSTPQSPIHLYASAGAQTKIYPNSIDIASNNASTPILNVAGGSGADLLRLIGASSSPVLYATSAGNVGIGTATPSYKLHVAETRTDTAAGSLFMTREALSANPATSSASDFYARYTYVTAGGAGNITGSIVGTYNSAYNTSNNDVTIAYGNLNYAGINSSSTSGTMTSATGAYNRAHNGSASGTITNAYGSTSAVDNNGAASVITNAYSQRLRLINDGAGSVVTNWYGLYVSPVSGTAPTTGRWPIYVADTGNSYFAGNIGLGTTSPQFKLHPYTSAAAGSDFVGLHVQNDSVTANTSASISFGATTSNTTSTAKISNILVNSNDRGLAFSTYNGTSTDEKLRITGTGRVGIGTATPDASSILDLTSTTQGFLPPRMTAAQRTAISTPANGLMVYDTDAGRYKAYQGGSWNDILTSAPGNGVSWSSLADPSANMALAMGGYTSTFTYGATTGSNVNLFNLTDTNSNTGTGFLMNIGTATGSTLKPFRVSANGTDAIVVRADGKVGVGGIASPQYMLHVGAGSAALTALTGNGANTYTPNIVSQTTSGVAGVGAFVNNGTNNRRATLFMNDTDTLWGLSQANSSGADVPFVIRQYSAERFRIDPSGNVIIGLGEGSSGTVTGNTLRSPDPAGTDKAGSHLTIRGGLGTGTGATGDVIFQSAPAGSTGTTAQTPTTAMIVKGGSGFVGIGNTSPAYKLDVLSTSTVASGTYLSTLNYTNVTPSGASSGTYTGATNDIRVTSGVSTDITGNITAGNNYARHAGTGVLDSGYGITNLYTATSTGNTTYGYGASNEARSSGANTIANAYGAQNRAIVNAVGATMSAGTGAYNIAQITNGTITNATGSRNTVYSSTTTAITNAKAVLGEINNASTAAITNAYGVQSVLDNTGGGAITNWYGLHVPAVTGTAPTNKYPLYVADTGQSYFTGNITMNPSDSSGTVNSPDLTLGVLKFNNRFDGLGNSTANKIILYDTGTSRYGMGVSSASFDLFAGGGSGAFNFYTGHQTEATPGTMVFAIDAPGYMRSTKSFAGAPTGTDCDAAAEVGRMTYDTSNNRWYVCTTTSGWVYAAMGASGGTSVAGSDKQIQFNDGGTTLAGAATLGWDKTNTRLGVGTLAPGKTLDVRGDAVIYAGGSSYGEGLNIFRIGGSGAGEGLNFHEGSVGDSTSGNSLSAYIRILPTVGHDDLVIGINDGTNDYAALAVQNATGNIGIRTKTPSYQLSLSGEANRTIGMERMVTAGTNGADLSLRAGGAKSATADLNGGNLYLMSGTATGTGSSNIYFQTAAAGATGTADRAPATAMTILGNNNVGIGITTPTAPLDVRSTSTITSGGAYNTYKIMSANPSAAGTGSYYGDYAQVTSAGTYDMTTMRGYRALVQHNTAAAVGNTRGIDTDVNNASTGTITDAIGGNFQASQANTTGSISRGYGVYGTTTNNRASGTGIATAYGLKGRVDNAAAGTITNGYGSYNEVWNSGGGTMTNAYGAQGSITNSASGTITNVYGLYSDLTNNGTAVTNWYGLYIAAVSGTAPATVRRPIYVADTGDSVMAGGLGIGSTSALASGTIFNVANGGYAQFAKNFAGAPTGTDCDAAGEVGRMTYDTTNNRWYVCTSTSGWVYTAMGASGGASTAAGSDKQIQFNDGGTTLAGAATLGWDKTNSRLGVGTLSPSTTIGLSGEAARTIGMERTAAGTTGYGLTVSAGGAKSATADLNGGDLTLSSGTSTGTGSSNIYFKTAPAAATGTSDNAPTTSMAILGSGNVGIGYATPGYLLDVRKTDTSTAASTTYMTYKGYTVSPAANSDTGFTTSYNRANMTTAFNLTAHLRAAYNIATHSGAGTVDAMYGAMNSSNNISSGTVTNSYGAYNMTDSSGGGASTSSIGAYNYARSNQASSTTTNLMGAYNYANVNLGTATNAIANYNNVTNGTTTTVAAATAVRALVQNTGNGTITNAYNLYADANNTSGTITNWYGLYIPAASGGGTTTNKYPIYVADTGESRLAGGLNIGSVSALQSGTIFNVANGGYAQFAKNFAGAPTGTDCDAAGEVGRMTYDTTNNRWYVCTSTSGWVYTAMGTSGGAATAAGSDKQIQFNDGGTTLAGAATLGWDKTGSGKLGIGTLSPSYTLDVRVADTATIPTNISGFDGQAQIYNTSDSANYSALKLQTRTTNSTMALMGLGYGTGLGDGYMFFRIRDTSTTNKEVMRLTADGNVGIGTATTPARLSLGGNKSAAAWTNSGIAINVAQATYTDTTSSAGINTTINYFGQPTFASTSATTPNVTNVRIDPPAYGTNASAGSLTALGVTGSSTSYAISTAIGKNSFTYSTTPASSGLITLTGTGSSSAMAANGVMLAVLANTMTDTSSSAGTVATRVSNSFGIPTMDSTNAVTYTNASNVYIAGAPAATGNTTITNPYALYSAAGNNYFGGNIYIGSGAVASGEKLSVDGNVEFVGSSKKFRIVPDSTSITYLQVGADNSDTTSEVRLSRYKTTGGSFAKFSSYAVVNYLDGYLQLGKNFAGAPTAGDCDNASEVGLTTYDTTNNRWYVCTSASGWVYTAMGASGGTSAAAGSDKQIQFNDGGTTLAGAATLGWDKTNSRLGVGTLSPSAKLDVLAYNIQVGADWATGTARTDATIKGGVITVPHTTNAEEPVNMIMAFGNTVSIGGGTSSFNAATGINFYTAPDTTTTTGTIKMQLLSDGTLQLGEGNGSATPVAALMRGADGTGTNIAGGSLTFRGGRATGNAASGDIAFQYAPAGSTGTTQQTPATAMTVKGGSGYVGIGTASPTANLHVAQTAVNASGLSVVGFANNATPVLQVASGGSPNNSLLSVLNSAAAQIFNVSNTSITIGSATGAAYWDNGNKRFGIGTTTPSTDLAFGGEAARTISMERASTGTNGYGLTISAGGAKSATADLAGGNLTLASGLATGTGSSDITFQTATAAATGSTDNTPTTKMTIKGDGKVGIGTTSPVGQLDVTATNTSTASTTIYNAYNQMTVAPASASDSNFNGIRNYVVTSGANDITGLITGAYAYGRHNGSGVLTTGYGANNFFAATGTGNATSAYGSYNEVQSTAANTIAGAYGALNRVRTMNASSVVTTSTGAYNETRVTAGTISNAYGSRNLVVNATTTAMTAAYAMSAEINNNSTASITNAYSVYGNLDNTGGGAITNWYGLYIPAAAGTAPTNKYPLYIADTGNSRMAGSLGIGSVSALATGTLFNVANGGYAQFAKNFAGAPTGTDCDAAGEVGRMTYDTTNNRWYVCTTSSGWVYAAMGTSGGTTAAAGSDKQIQFNDGGTTLAGAAQLYWDKTNNRLGIGTSAPTQDISFGGAAARRIGMERATSGIGNDMYLSAGGAQSGGTDLNGGDVYIRSGMSTGAGASRIYFQPYPAGSTGTADNSTTTMMTVSGIGVGIGTTSPQSLLHVATNGMRYLQVDPTNARVTVAANDNTNVNALVLRNTYDGGYGVGVAFSLGYGGTAGVAGTAVGGATIRAIPEQVFTATATTQDSALAFLTSLDGTQTERMRITSDGKIGAGVTAPSYDLSFAGNAGRWIGSERKGTGAGSNLGLVAGGAQSGGTDLAGGDLYLRSGMTTGTGTSNILFQSPTAGATGTADNSYSTAMVVTNGKVGIGTSTPSSPLHVVGTGQFVASGTERALLLSTSSSSDETIQMYRSANTSPLQISFQPAGSITGSNKQFFAGIPANGNRFVISAGTGGGGTQYLAVGNGGSIGLGPNTATFTYPVTLNGEANVTIGQDRTSNGTNGYGLTLLAGGGKAGTDRNGGDLTLSSGIATGSGSSNIVFQTATAGATGTTDRAPSTKMTISSTSVMIGRNTQSTSTPAALLVQHTNASNYGLVINSDSASASSVVMFDNPNGNVGSISVTGSATAYNTSSDRRLKENVIATAKGLDTVMRLPVYDFSFKSDATHKMQTGFMAQELAKVFPDAVTTNGDDGEVALNGKGGWSVDYGRVTPILVKAVQELKSLFDGLAEKVAQLFDMVSQLKAENAELRSQVDTLKAQNTDILKRLEALEAK